jgi:chemotaxis protein CheC
MADEPTFNQEQRRILTSIFERGAEDASVALSKWLSQPTQLTVSAVEDAELSEAAEMLGPADALVAVCAIELSGRLAGHLLLVFEDKSGLALADLLLRQPLGKATQWGELEQSAALETANIVCCAYLNSLAAHLPMKPEAADAHNPMLLPSPPLFRHEFAGSLLQFALMDQAMRLERLLLIRSNFSANDTDLNWCLLLVLTAESLNDLSNALAQAQTE